VGLVIRHPVTPSLLFLAGCGFIAAAGVIVIAGWIEVLADWATEGTENADDADEAQMDADGEREGVAALRAAQKRVYGDTSEHFDKVLRERKFG
jgi:hypothetical protein